MAGHSKWAQVKHKKAATDAKKGKLFSKLVKEIAVAARAGSPDPTGNPRLRSALERARAAGLPKDNIQRAIAKTSGGGEGEQLKEFLYEAAVGGVSILIEGITDNTNRTFNEIRHLFSARNGRMAEPGSLAWNFEKIGTLDIASADNPGVSPQDLEMEIIEAGASDFTTEEEVWIVETPFALRERVREALESKKIVIRQEGHDYKPRHTIAPEPQQKDLIEQLLDALGEHDDVQEVYTNMNE